MSFLHVLDDVLSTLPGDGKKTITGVATTAAGVLIGVLAPAVPVADVLSNGAELVGLVSAGIGLIHKIVKLFTRG